MRWARSIDAVLERQQPVVETDGHDGFASVSPGAIESNPIDFIDQAGRFQSDGAE